jgi:hypothetical protein
VEVRLAELGVHAAAVEEAVDVLRVEAGVGERAFDRLGADLLVGATAGPRVVAVADTGDRDLAVDRVDGEGPAPARECRVAGQSIRSPREIRPRRSPRA